MVALLTTDPIYRRPSAPSGPRSGAVRPRHLEAVSLPAEPAWEVVDKRTTAEAASPVDRAAIDPIWLGIALVIFGVAALVGLRMLQGSPPPGTWADVQQASRSAPPAAGVDDLVVTVQPGQTLWGIAGELAPSADRREAVQILTVANGGAAIWAGQDLVVPAALVASQSEAANG